MKVKKRKMSKKRERELLSVKEIKELDEESLRDYAIWATGETLRCSKRLGALCEFSDSVYYDCDDKNSECECFAIGNDQNDELIATEGCSSFTKCYNCGQYWCHDHKPEFCEGCEQCTECCDCECEDLCDKKDFVKCPNQKCEKYVCKRHSLQEEDQGCDNCL